MCLFARAELPVARLTTISPPGGKIGSTVEVTVGGSDLDHVTELRFSREGVSASPKLNDAKQPEPNRFIVTIATNAPVGVYEARVIGRFGASNPRAFAVSGLPQHSPPATNHTIESAIEIALNTDVHGHTEANNVDWFKFTAKKGQRILAECVAREMDSRLDPVMVLFDAGGRELARSRRSALLDVITQEDGILLLKLHDFTFRGGPEHFYRLIVGDLPRIDYAVPAAIAPGTKSKVTLFGRNLPGSAPAADITIDGRPIEKLEVEIEAPADPALPRHANGIALPPAAAGADAFEYRLATPLGASNPVLLGFADAPVVAEQASNDKPSEAQPLTAPCEFVGQFYPAGDQDWVKFDAKKGDVYWLDVFSHRLGLPTDPFALVQRVTTNDKGEEKSTDIQELYDNDTNIGGREFPTITRDPSWRFEVKEDGAYRVLLRDLFNPSRSDPRHVYCLAIRQESPDFRLVALPQIPAPVNKESREIPLWTPLLRRGGVLPVKVLAFRRDNFGGAIELTVEGLPSGVRCEPARIDAGATAATLFLLSDASATNWVGALRVIGKAKAGESELVRVARAASTVWPVGDFNTEPVQARLADEFVMSVSGIEPVPVALAASEEKIWETCPGAKLQIPLLITRTESFPGKFKLKTAGIGPLDQKPEFEIAEKATNATVEIDLAQQKLGVGAHSFYVYAQAPGKYIRLTADEIKAAEEEKKSAEAIVKEVDATLAELKAAAQKTSEALAAATKSAAELDAMAKAASEKLAGVTTAVSKLPADEGLNTAKSQAERENADAAAKAKAVAEAKSAADKANIEAQTKLKEAEAKKADAANRAKATAERLKPADVNATFYTPPIRVQVLPAPLKITATPPPDAIARGAKVELPVAIERLFGFADAVELSLDLQGAKGLSAAKLLVPKDQAQGKVVIETSGDAPAGEHAVKLIAAVKFNGQDLKTKQAVMLKFATAAQAATPPGAASSKTGDVK